MEQSNTLEVAAHIHTPLGWLDLQDPAGGYELDASAFADRTVSHRKIEISSGWMEGTFVTRSVRENVTEMLAVQIRGDNESQFNDRVNILTDALEQISYQFAVSFGLAEQIWQCTVADYSLSTTHAERFSIFGILKAQIPRLPAVDYSTMEDLP